MLKPLTGMGVAIAVLLVVGWGMLFVVVLPGEYLIGDQVVFGTGLALTAFTLGLRHGFDPDHIAAIDNTARRLVHEGKRPVTIGFWFALGHSTVVILTVVLLTAGVSVLAEQLAAERSTLTQWSGVWGLVVSSLFLLFIGTVNLMSLQGIWRAFRQLGRGALDEAMLERLLVNRGVLNRLLGPAMRRVDQPWKMYIVGILFGLGLDTATTIALFVAGGTAVVGAPWYVALVLPILFTAGMTVVDALDGVVMHHAYAWAFAAPVRRIYYNLTVTLISVAVAFLIGGVGLTTLLVDVLRVDSPPLAWVASIDIGRLGVVIAVVLVVTWVVAHAYWKLARVESRYALAPAAPTRPR